MLSTAAGDHIVPTQRVAGARLRPGRTTSIWGYDGIFPGPTIRARRGRPLTVTVRNELPVPTSTHLHGGVTPADSDGFPLDLITPAGYSPAPPHAHGTGARVHEVSRDYRYPMDQRAATLWYHDHRMDFTGPQVWRGLAGMLIVSDDEDALPLPRSDRPGGLPGRTPGWAPWSRGASPATSTTRCTCTWPTSRCCRAAAGVPSRRSPGRRTRWTCGRTRRSRCW